MYFAAIKVLKMLRFCLHSSPLLVDVNKFFGDASGNLHVGDKQIAVINHQDDLKFLVNVYIYEGGEMYLPPNFRCTGISITVW